MQKLTMDSGMEEQYLAWSGTHNRNMRYYLYIIYSDRFDKYYIGQTNNIEIRLNQHNDGRNKSTKHYCPWKLIFEKGFSSRHESMKLEKYLKSLKNKERILQ